LTENLRATRAEGSDRTLQLQWADELLQIGEGRNYTDEEKQLIEISGSEKSILGKKLFQLAKFSDDMLAQTFDELIERIFPALTEEIFNGNAILAPTNAFVRRVNDEMMSRLPGEEHTYLAYDNSRPFDSLLLLCIFKVFT
jgi:hypothetical protein